MNPHYVPRPDICTKLLNVLAKYWITFLWKLSTNQNSTNDVSTTIKSAIFWIGRFGQGKG